MALLAERVAAADLVASPPPQAGKALGAGEVFFCDFHGDGAEGVVADADAGDVGEQVVGPPAVAAVVGFEPLDEAGGGFGDGALHGAAAGDGHDFGWRFDAWAGKNGTRSVPTTNGFDAGAGKDGTRNGTRSVPTTDGFGFEEVHGDGGFGGHLQAAG